MKTTTQLIFIFIILLPINLLSQVENERKTIPGQLLPERIKFNSILIEQFRHPLLLDNFLNKESRTIVNKTILDNGFLLVELIRQNWDGSANNLHQQIDMVVKSRHEFNTTWSNIIVKLTMDNEFQSNFNTSYPDGLTKENIIDAIVEFEKTLITPNSPFDRYLRNDDTSLTKEEIEGYILFKKFGCISCHQGTNIGSNLFQKFGIFYNYMAERGDVKKQDYGKFNTTHREIDKFVFKVPSLRNVAVTAPYFHDGSAKTIEQAISIMGKTQLGRILTEKEIFLIKSFLNTLTGEYKNKPLGVQS